ncbi:MAG TPA: FAD-dependent oxidoreductase [Gemmatimonadaceae bacterium]|nr:FAD-dependent oxidoreductase [Gemmatimonadaceae bacterium]
MSDTHVVVIGGGFAGVAAAVRLAAAGVRVTLLEAREQLGGRARTDLLEDVHVDTGAQLIASSFTHTRRLLERGDGPTLRVTAGRDVYVRDERRLPIQFGSIRSLLAFPGIGALEKLKLAGTLLPLLARHRAHLDADATRLPASLDRQSAREYVTQHAGSHVADVLVEPLLNAFYAARGDEASFGFFLTLGHYGSDSDVLAPVGGWSHLLERALSGIAHETGRVVDSIRVSAGGVSVHANARDLKAHGAIIATGPRMAETLVRQLPGAQVELLTWLATLELRRTVTLALAVDTALDRDTFGAFTDPSPTRVVSACAVYGAKLGSDAPARSDVVLAWPAPSEAARLAEASSDAVVSAMMPEIEQLVPRVRGRIRRARVYRMEEGTPLARTGFAASRERGRQLADSIAGPIALAGDYLTTPLIEGAVLSGEHAADRLLGKLARK